MLQGGVGSGISKHFVIAQQGLDLIFNQSVIVFTTYRFPLNNNSYEGFLIWALKIQTNFCQACPTLAWLS